MSSKSRPARRAAARTSGSGGSASRWILPLVGGAIVAVAVLAILVGQGSGDAAAAPSAPASEPAAAASPSAPPSASADGHGLPVITGASLPRYDPRAVDAAIGLAAPTVAGHDYEGQPVGISPTGRPTLVIFAAHWCPHCQREVPLLQAWIDAGGVPDDVDLVSVSTAVDPSAPNYPPAAWLAAEDWTVPVIDDPTSSVGLAFGVSGYPMFVVLDGAGTVVARTSGEIPMADLEEMLAAVPRS